MKKVIYFLIPLIIFSACESNGLENLLPEETVELSKSAGEAVDLGLSVKWATCNIGATKPEEYGDYFAWGEVSPKDSFSEENHKWIRTWWHETEDGSCPIPGYHSHTEFTKYHSHVDSKTILDKEDDAAVVNWGENWRMPTWDETKELLDKCIWEMTSQNGVSGFKVIGTNGNSIFLPADFSFGSQSGYSYWTSTVDYKYNEYQSAIMLYLDDDGDAYWEIGARHSGKMVRPVKGSNNTSSTPTEPSNPSAGIGAFSVSDDTQVTFSPGNLQYHPANDEWRFAENQADYIGDANSNISDTYNGWLDLFGWSTASSYFGVSTSENNEDYYGSFVDWGTNQIGTEAPNTWRTLTKGEWYYLFNVRTNASSLYGVAHVCGIGGMVVLPDNWITPTDISFKSGLSESSYRNHQTFTYEQWLQMEKAGAVFLPANGYREGTSVDDVRIDGYYWSSTGVNNGAAYDVYFSDSNVMESIDLCNRGQSVRLVKDL